MYIIMFSTLACNGHHHYWHTEQQNILTTSKHDSSETVSTSLSEMFA